MSSNLSPGNPGAKAGNVAAAAIIPACALALFITSPLDGSFWWSDAPRHALNGIFLKDVIAQYPFADPKQFAFDWYAQYPALTILFYPPLLYVLSAPAFLLFGESHAVAQAVIALHLMALGFGTYALARFWLADWAAIAAAVILLTFPEIALWGRQVMLDVPALAYLVWAAVFAVRHARRGDTLSLFLAAAFAIASLYVKINVGFLAPVLVVFLLRARGLRMLAERRTWAVALAAAAGIAPLLAMTALFGQANVQSVSGLAGTVPSRASLAGWLWYGRQSWQSAGLPPWPSPRLACSAPCGRQPAAGAWGSGCS